MAKAPVQKPRTLASLIRAIPVKDMGSISDETLRKLSLYLILETTEDLPDKPASRGKLKLEALRFLHEMNQDDRVHLESSNEDEDMLAALRPKDDQ